MTLLKQFLPYKLKTILRNSRRRAYLLREISRLPTWKLEFLSPEKYFRDGVITMHDRPFERNADFMNAYRQSVQGLESVYLHRGIPEWKDMDEIVWRSHICCWATNLVQRTPGNFVECGVAYGILSLTILNYLKTKNSKSGVSSRKFFLVDTWLPMHGDRIENIFPFETNLSFQEFVQKRFENYPDVVFVPGLVPDVLVKIPQEPIAFLSIDMNDGDAELHALNILWDRISDGGVIYFDDFGYGGWKSYEKLQTNLNSFFSNKDGEMLYFPTGQSIFIKYC